MIRTFNRQPLSVNIPDKNDVEHKYLNQYNWKGLVDNKNFLAVDQESFSDCNNVYVDEQGLLKSRPSLKHKAITIVNGNNKLIVNKILDCWTFDVVTIYKTDTYLIFVNENFINQNVWTENTNDIKLVPADNKIFVFEKDKLTYYDIITNEYKSAEDLIYVPTTKIYHNNTLTDEVIGESKNILTNKENIKYVFDSIKYDYSNFIGKRLTLKIDEIEYKDYLFKKESQLTFVNEVTTVSEKEFLNGKPLIDVAENGVIIKSIYEGNSVNNTCLISYSLDGILFNTLSTVSNIKGVPKLTKDGFHVVVFTSEGLLIKSLVKTKDVNGTLTYEYPEWTDLLKQQSNYTSFYSSLGSSVQDFTDNEGFFYYGVKDSMFISDDNFTFTFKVGYGFTAEFIVICLNGTLTKVLLSDPGYVTNKATITMGTSTITTETNYKVYTKESLSNYFTYFRNDAAYKDNVSYNRIRVDLDTIKYYEKITTSSTYAQSIIEVSGTITTHYNDNSTTDFSDDTTHTDTFTATGNSNFSILPSSEEYIGKYGSKNYIIYSVVSNRTNYKVTFSIKAYQSGSTLYFLIEPGSVEFKLLTSTNKMFFSGLPTYEQKTLIDSANQIYNLQYLYTHRGDNKIFMYIDSSSGTVKYNTSLLFTSRLYKNSENEYDNITSIVNYNSIITGTPTRDELYYKKKTDTRDISKDALNIVRGTTYWATILNNDLHVHNFVYKTDASFNKVLVDYDSIILNNVSNDETLILSYDGNYLLTNNYMFPNSSYLQNDVSKYNPIKLLHNNVKPVSYWYANNEVDAMYYVHNNTLYSSKLRNPIELIELLEGEHNYLLPDNVNELSDIYMSYGKELYISKNIVDVEGNFKWYLPEINKQSFDYDITNLHPISSTEMAIFFNNSVHYVTYDTDVSAYRYFKTKLQVGCKKGCDVITTFDGKYVIFPSDRGLVAMSYQQFVATTEQSLDYLTDTIHNVFYSYIEEGIKLFKYDYWIIVYKNNSNKYFVFDLRSSSWWPMEVTYNINKFAKIGKQICLLYNNDLHYFDGNEINYFDTFKNKLHKNIVWHIRSQKLHLNALNYYKHIVNMTLNSVHNVTKLLEAEYNINDINFKLQINNYRDKVVGNIDTNECINIDYDVNIVKTFIQRLNYSKVNEFEYKLSSNDKGIQIPLSLSSITIKYKIGGQIR